VTLGTALAEPLATLPATRHCVCRSSWGVSGKNRNRVVACQENKSKVTAGQMEGYVCESIPGEGGGDKEHTGRVAGEGGETRWTGQHISQDNAESPIADLSHVKQHH
jgi:hypothetical protein